MFEIVLGRVSEWVQNLESVTHTPENQRRKIVHSKDKKIGLKSQSAMEYLTTYGWAILILAIVLVAFFSLGVFNPYTFSPKASPGSCQILRPNSPGTTASEIGPCTNEIPQFIASFTQNGEYISGNSIALLNNLPSFTISAWVDSINGNFIYSEGIPDATLNLEVTSAGAIEIHLWNQGYSGNWYFSNSSTGAVKAGSINFITVTLSNGGVGTGNVIFYVNGKFVSSTTGQSEFNPTTHYYAIGNNVGSLYGGLQSAYQYNGSIANLQIYNATLSKGEIQALYTEGIGGAPIDLQNLVGWWPLNGNSKDYSGNGNNGVPTNVIFTSSWENGYTAP